MPGTVVGPWGYISEQIDSNSLSEQTLGIQVFYALRFVELFLRLEKLLATY